MSTKWQARERSHKNQKQIFTQSFLNGNTTFIKNMSTTSSRNGEDVLLLTTEPIRLSQLVIDAPSELDILCSKNRIYKRHRGNREYDAMIDSYLSSYMAATANGKKQEVMGITKEIVSKMQTQFGSRFLKPDGNGAWEVTSDAIARDKVRHALAFKARSMAPRSGQALSSNSSGNAFSHYSNTAEHNVGSSGNTAAPSSSEEDGSSSLRVESVLQRQQVILDSLSVGMTSLANALLLDFPHDCHCGRRIHPPLRQPNSSSVAPPEHDHHEEIDEEYNYSSLRMEDLHDIFNGPPLDLDYIVAMSCL
jgi:hypothetical protein